ncbi:MAG: hypothetical protein OWU33_09945 [Firmicutes bacterium]|nr:hypothetical protein [Bacillota bacterium]
MTMSELLARVDRTLAHDFGVTGEWLLDSLVPDEFQGFAGVLRGHYRLGGEEMRVRLAVEPWSLDERWTVMVQGRQLGESRFWEWLWEQPLCRIPFLTTSFESDCSQCGTAPCIHGAALTVRWLHELPAHPQFVFLLLNRDHYHKGLDMAEQPIQHVPLALGSNLDRTRRDLAAIVEAAIRAAMRERDNVFGRANHEDLGNRP